MKVPFYNFTELHNEEFRKDIKEVIGSIIDAGSFVEGEFNTKFENDFAKMQSSKYCLLVANGTDALEIALKAYDIKAGDKVGVPGITFYATIEAVLNVGATPVYIDVDPIAGLMCPDSVKRMSEKHELKAIMPVHIYGLPAPINELEKICNPKNIKIIEDAAQAQGTLLPTGPVGSTNNITTFSFYPTKNLSAFGDAGGMLTQDDELARKIKVIRNHGRGDDTAYGRNSRCDHMQAAVLYKKLEKIDGYNKNRKATAAKYHKALAGLDKIKLLPSSFIETSSWHLYPFQVESKEERVKIQAALKEAGIASTPFYEEALSEMNAFKGYEGEDENAKKFAGHTVCLPIHPFVKDEDVEYIAQTIKNYFK